MVQSMIKTQFNIDKRFSDFIDLMKQLTNDNKNLTYPELPTRYHLMKEDLDKRGRELEEFLSIMLNDKKFCGQQVLEFLDLDTHQCGILLGKQEVNLFSKFNFVIQVNGYVKQTTDGYNNDPFVAWKIYVKVTDLLLNVNVIHHEVKRRYNDFDKLHKLLKIRFKNTNIKLPKFPRGGKPYKKGFHCYRMQQLDRYLKELCEVRGVFDSIHW